MSFSAFYFGQAMLTALEQVDHGGQHGNAAPSRVQDETSETDNTQKQCSHHIAI